MKTLSKFVLIDNDKKQETPLQWKTNGLLQSRYHKSSTNLNYKAKKNLISTLNPSQSLKKVSIRKISTKKHLPTSASTNKITPFIYAKLERENGMRQTQFYQTDKTRSISSRLPPRQASLPTEEVQMKQIRDKIVEGDRRKGRIICILTMRRYGLRFRLKNQFFLIHPGIIHEQFIERAKQKLFPELMSVKTKPLYLFHLGKEPINNINSDVNPKEFVIFGDISPKFNLSFEIQMKLFEQASHIEESIVNELKNFQQMVTQEIEPKLEVKDESEPKYEWQTIINVKKHVQQIIQNPELIRALGSERSDQRQLEWFLEKYTEQKNEEKQKGSKIKQEKHPFFDLKSHFPKETGDERVLGQASKKIEELPIIQNKHKFKKKQVENMMEKIKRENEEAEERKREEAKKQKLIGYKSEKQFLRQLDDKNEPLFKQNIPYIMEKYEITRAQAYNLYNIYKSLQKISAMRLFDENEFRSVKEKGIDRKTFDQGMKGLEINPGEEVIKNICYFPEFISWEEFIKIISISLRKTPESKLEAILEGIGSKTGQLTRNQIGIMVGSSLHKIFGTDEPELRQYFVNMVMKVLDKDESGTISTKELKDHVFESSVEDMDLVSYLMLNS